MPCLASISEVAEGTVLRSGFRTFCAAAAFNFSQFPFSRGQLLGQLCLAPALLDGGGNLLHLAGQSRSGRSSSRLERLSSRAVAASSRSTISFRPFPCHSFLVLTH